MADLDDIRRRLEQLLQQKDISPALRSFTEDLLSLNNEQLQHAILRLHDIEAKRRLCKTPES